MDIRTLIVVLGITHLIQVCVFFQQYKIDKADQGSMWWFLWSVAAVIGFGFMLMREMPSIHLMAILAQNSMIFLGTIFIYVGVMRFLDKKVNWTVTISAYAAFIAAFAYFVYVNNDIFIRSVIISGSLAAISFLTARALYIHKMPFITASANFNAAIFLIHGGIFTHRTVMILAGTPTDNIFTPSLFNTIPYLDAIIVSLLWTFGFIIMINQRLNAETREASEHFELIFNTSPDASLITRIADGFIVDINEGFTTLTGFTRDEAIGKSTLDIPIWKNPEDRQKVLNELNKKGFCENSEAVFLRKDGSETTGILSAKIITLHDAPHIFSITRDITGRKKDEEALQQYSAELKKRNKELDEALANVKTLSKLLPICSHCKNIRDDKGDWSKIESYIHKHSDTQFSHSICPECAKKYYPDIDLYGDTE